LEPEGLGCLSIGVKISFVIGEHAGFVWPPMSADGIQKRHVEAAQKEQPLRDGSGSWSNACDVCYFQFKTVVGDALLIAVFITISFPEFLIWAVLIAQP